MSRTAVDQLSIAGIGELGFLFCHRKGARRGARLEIVVAGEGDFEGIGTRRAVRCQAAARDAVGIGLRGARLGPEREGQARSRHRGLAGAQPGRQGGGIVEVAAGRPGVSQPGFDGGDVDILARLRGRVEPITAEAGADAAATEWLAGRSRGATGEPVGIG